MNDMIDWTGLVHVNNLGPGEDLVFLQDIDAIRRGITVAVERLVLREFVLAHGHQQDMFGADVTVEQELKAQARFQRAQRAVMQIMTAA